LVLDEVDKLFHDSLRAQSLSIISFLPENKQTLAFSASMDEKTLNFLCDPHLQITKTNVQKILFERAVSYLPGIKQFYFSVQKTENQNENKETQTQIQKEITNIQTYTPQQQMSLFQEKTKKLIEILGKISFHQCLIFVNNKAKAEWLARKLTHEGRFLCVLCLFVCLYIYLQVCLFIICLFVRLAIKRDIWNTRAKTKTRNI
jgi:superfamily II DNA/RNA helicase